MPSPFHSDCDGSGKSVKICVHSFY